MSQFGSFCVSVACVANMGKPFRALDAVTAEETRLELEQLLIEVVEGGGLSRLVLGCTEVGARSDPWVVEHPVELAPKGEAAGDAHCPYGVQAIGILDHRQLEEGLACLPCELVLRTIPKA